MKTRMLIASIALSMFGVAQADETKIYPQVNVTHPGGTKEQVGYSMDCTPPNWTAECEQFHREIRKNFTMREISMLFGPTTAYPESRAIAPRVAERFERFARAYDEQHPAATNFSTN